MNSNNIILKMKKENKENANFSQMHTTARIYWTVQLCLMNFYTPCKIKI